jgi:hypothetical protein
MPPPTSNHLCDVCSGLDFTRYFKVIDKDQATGSAPGVHRDAIQLGYLPDIIARSADCAFCYLAVEALCLRWSKARAVRPEDLLQVKGPTGREIKCSIYSFMSGLWKGRFTSSNEISLRSVPYWTINDERDELVRLLCSSPPGGTHRFAGGRCREDRPRCFWTGRTRTGWTGRERVGTRVSARV